MYFVTKETVIIENKVEELFGISDGNTVFPCLTPDRNQAESLASILNENNVEPNHINDIIEDMFYT